jgi:hypothetical protein
MLVNNKAVLAAIQSDLDALSRTESQIPHLTYVSTLIYNGQIVANRMCTGVHNSDVNAISKRCKALSKMFSTNGSLSNKNRQHSETQASA